LVRSLFTPYLGTTDPLFETNHGTLSKRAQLAITIYDTGAVKGR
jgi:hypothetical protein